ncbi:hypothetical protein VDG1235_2934 [Verrucomicrobiia bacterium DG1235]|nr:hypothetical protein VDG1235_2934 [Verrucomicrobiae bacterium DG1235]
MNTSIFILITVELFWLCGLVAHLRTKDLDPTDKICWTVVLTILNALGVVLYILFGPKTIKEDKEDYETRIKRLANEGRL